MNILVTGAKGYIGQLCVEQLLNLGHRVVVYDQFENSAENLNGAVTLYENLQDESHLPRALKNFKIETVLHFSPYPEVYEGHPQAGKFYEKNIASTIRILKAMVQAHIKKIVFSSTASIYGAPQKTPILETQPTNPLNFYSRSQLISEMIIQDYSVNHGIGFVILRYFDSVGFCSGYWSHAQIKSWESMSGEGAFVPEILFSAIQNKPIKLFGVNYSTADGTYIRDYVHATDLANAHVLASSHVVPEEGEIFNLGSDSGYSVLEVISACQELTGRSLEIIRMPAKPHVPEILVASSGQARNILHWEKKIKSLPLIIRHAWQWQSQHNREIKIPYSHGLRTRNYQTKPRYEKNFGLRF